MVLEFPSGTNAQTNLVTFKTVSEFEPNGTVATNQTGRFPVLSSQGNQYVMVAYIQDSNAILAIPIKKRSENLLVTSYSTIYKTLTTAGLKPILHICNNKCPKAFKNPSNKKI